MNFFAAQLKCVNKLLVHQSQNKLLVHLSTQSGRPGAREKPIPTWLQLHWMSKGCHTPMCHILKFGYFHNNRLNKKICRLCHLGVWEPIGRRNMLMIYSIWIRNIYTCPLDPSPYRRPKLSCSHKPPNRKTRRIKFKFRPAETTDQPRNMARS